MLFVFCVVIYVPSLPQIFLGSSPDIYEDSTNRGGSVMNGFNRAVKHVESVRG